MKEEAELYAWLKRKLEPECDCLRIETSTISGVFDFNIAFNSPLGGVMETWVECKAFDGRDGVPLRKNQLAWGHRRAHLGHRYWLIGWDYVNGIYYFWQFPIRKFRRLGSVLNPTGYVIVEDDPAYAFSKTVLTKELIRILFGS